MSTTKLDNELLQDAYAAAVVQRDALAAEVAALTASRERLRELANIGWGVANAAGDPAVDMRENQGLIDAFDQAWDACERHGDLADGPAGGIEAVPTKRIKLKFRNINGEPAGGATGE